MMPGAHDESDRAKKVLSLRERRVRRGGPAAPTTRSPQDTGEITLAETLDRVLSRGVVARAEVVLAVADIPLVYVGLQALVSSVETVAELSRSER